MESRLRKLSELLDRSGASIFKLLVRLTLNEDVAGDLMQDLFMKLANANAMDKAENLDAYARRSAMNIAFDWRQRCAQASLPLDKVREPAAEAASPLGKLIQREEIEGVLDAIAKLNGITRDAVVMHYIHQLPFGHVTHQFLVHPARG